MCRHIFANFTRLSAWFAFCFWKLGFYEFVFEAMPKSQIKYGDHHGDENSSALLAWPPKDPFVESEAVSICSLVCVLPSHRICIHYRYVSIFLLSLLVRLMLVQMIVVLKDWLVHICLRRSLHIDFFKMMFTLLVRVSVRPLVLIMLHHGLVT